MTTSFAAVKVFSSVKNIGLKAMAHHYHHHIDHGLIDQTIDSAVVDMRAKKNQEKYENKLNELVDGNVSGYDREPLSVASGKKKYKGKKGNNELNEPLLSSTDNDDIEIIDARDIRKREDTSSLKDDRIIYNSINRGACYYAFGWLWCGCFEPKYKITGSYAIGESWQSCCLRVTDSMPYENVQDVQRRQGCCCWMVSCCPICCCCNDMADIVLIGYWHNKKNLQHWKLKRIHQSNKVFDTLTRTVQATNQSSKHK